MLHFDRTAEFKETFLSIFASNCCPVYLNITNNLNNEFEKEHCNTIFDGMMKTVRGLSLSITTTNSNF